jgi:hypothetical protein
VRYNIFDGDRLVGQDYTRENGKWSHKWFISRDKKFERGSWPGRAQGENMDKWKYVEIEEK